jgi:transketolase
VNNAELRELAAKIRKCVIETAYNSRQSVHIGGAMSMAEILAVLYGKIMRYDPNHPEDDSRDRLILSKGHGSIGLYAALNLSGFISDDELSANYLTDGGYLQTHTVKNIGKGIECTSGSLGMGLSFGTGKALAAKLDDKNYKTIVIAGDGECNEGEIWEAVATAKQYKLDNLVLIVDRNRFQLDGPIEEIMNIDLVSVLKSFGWNVSEVDGHDVEALADVLSKAVSNANSAPSAIVANTVKGKGVSFMENNNAWHHGHLSEEQYRAAKGELCDD